jgi:hypothetical protein
MRFIGGEFMLQKERSWLILNEYSGIIKLDDLTLKQVPKFKYLGSIITEDGKNE